jgi:hypothetical protein
MRLVSIVLQNERRHAAKLLAGVLAITLLNGIRYWVGGEPPPQQWLAPGSRFPGEFASVEDSAVVPDRCEMIVVFSPICPVCRALAQWYETEASQDGPLWVAVEGPSLSEPFREEFSIARERLVYAGRQTATSNLRELGLKGVPSGILLREGVVEKVQVGWAPGLPPFDGMSCQ